jgi:hypothetical protein
MSISSSPISSDERSMRRERSRGPGRSRAAAADYVEAGDHTSGRPPDRVTIAANREQSTAIAAISGTSA